MYNVTILMSTYNGGRYLREQIDSVLNQKGVNLTLIVRDDGSSDNTLIILDSYQKKQLLTWYQGANLRSAYSFWALLEQAPGCDYYGFADQDDVWYENKIVSAIKRLETHKEPTLYFCRKRITDQDLTPLQMEDETVNYLGLGTNLLHCRAAGCTMVFNKSLMDLLRLYRPEVMSMHDSWILRVASACGTVIFDPRTFMDYRQHEANVVGTSTSKARIWKKRLCTITGRRYDDERTRMAKQLYDNYAGYIQNDEIKQQLKYFSEIRSSLSARWNLVTSDFLKPQSDKERFFVKLIVLLGWL